jgi:CRP-like cAMP-binding protein
MLMSTVPSLAALSQKLTRLAVLSDEDRRAVLDLPVTLMTSRPGRCIVREGDKTDHVTVVRSGLAYSCKVAGDGGRMIVAFHMPGDIIGFHGVKPMVADCTVQGVSTCELAQVSRQDLVDLAATSPGITEALWRDREIEASILREWALNLGRRNARTRVAHLICELMVRQSVASMGYQSSFEFLVTQEQIGDALGLTAVHVNRTVQQLRRDGLIAGAGRVLVIPDWSSLAAAADFQPAYLHLPLDVPAAPAGARKSHHVSLAA